MLAARGSLKWNLALPQEGTEMTYKWTKVTRKIRSFCGNFYTLYFEDNSSLFLHQDELTTLSIPGLKSGVSRRF